MKSYKKLSLILASSLLFASCASTTNSIDENGQVVAPAKVDSSLSSLGLKEFEKYKRTKRVSKNAAYNAQLRRVASRLTKVVSMPGAQWEFVVFEDPTANAFALPGGKVGIHTGLFAITQTDAGLAAVVGHEIAHITRNHAQTRISRASNAALLGGILDTVLVANGATTAGREVAASAYGLGSNYGSQLPFSRKQEYEADRIGTIYMAQAGYDPRETVALWKRFAAHKSSTSQTPQWMSTHPISTNRITALEEFMPIALKQYKR